LSAKAKAKVKPPAKPTEPTGRQNNLQEIRITEGLAITALAALGDVNERTIRRIEGGSSKSATPVTKHKILNGLNRHLNRKKDYTFKDLFPNDDPGVER